MEVAKPGINAPPRPTSPWRYHRTLAQGSRQQVQLREDDLSEMLRSSSSPGDELQEEEVRTFEPAEAEEEDQVVVCWWHGSIGGRDGCCGCCGKGWESGGRCAAEQVQSSQVQMDRLKALA
jgi:hypothetical protein